MKFINKFREMRFIMKSARSVQRDGLFFTEGGHHIKFVNGQYETNNEEEINYLKSTPDFGITLFIIKETENEKVENLKQGIEMDKKIVEAKTPKAKVKGKIKPKVKSTKMKY